jgi:hypothetical protein
MIPWRVVGGVDDGGRGAKGADEEGVLEIAQNRAFSSENRQRR